MERVYCWPTFVCVRVCDHTGSSSSGSSRSLSLSSSASASSTNKDHYIQLLEFRARYLELPSVVVVVAVGFVRRLARERGIIFHCCNARAKEDDDGGASIRLCVVSQVLVLVLGPLSSTLLCCHYIEQSARSGCASSRSSFTPLEMLMFAWCLPSTG